MHIIFNYPKRKIMKKSILAIAFIALSTLACKTDKKKVITEKAVKEIKKVEDPISSYKASISESTITWKGFKPLESHNGTIKILKGIFDIQDGILKAGEFTIDMNSINCLDLEAGKGKAKLEGHLKNADFFDVKNFPTAKFAVTGSEIKGTKNLITGNFTLRGETKSITIPVTITEDEAGNATFKSDIFSIDRTEFGVTYKSKKIDAALKDKFIKDLIEISFDIKAKK